MKLLLRTVLQEKRGSLSENVRKKDGNCTKSGSPAKGCRKTAFFVLTPDALIHAGAGDLHDLSVLREFTLDEFREVGA